MKTPCLLLILFMLAGAGPSSAATPADSALAFETSDFAKATLYKSGPGFGLSMAPSGAFGLNNTWESTHGGKWFIEYQRIGAEAIGAGLALGNDAAIERGLMMIEWGFAHMEADGSFQCEDAYHSASFFIEATAYALLLLEASPAHEKWQPRVEALKPALGKAAHWMAKPTVAGPVWNGVQKQFAHRWFACAAALGESGVLLHDKELLATAKPLLHGGLRAQLPNGVNPEKGGYDSIYQAAGLVYATHYYAIVADPADRPALKQSIDKGVAWLVSRISSDGVISTQGNTRTAGQEVGRSGNVKGVETKYAVRSLGFWAALTGNSSLQALSQKVSAAPPGER
ncbi:MAG: hypothetical protein ABJF10_17150 [Chthoniobacter sp.]|uniref:hypothetical protein n=1 Tax=Chthoniobacter sp. TaxID=2510640 RepID=UPI0032A790FF